MSSNKLKIQLLRENDLANDTGKQVEFGSKWCDFFEIDNSVRKITFNLVFKSLSIGHASINNRVIPLELSELTERKDRKAYSNGKAGHSAIKEFFINDLHLSQDNIKRDYFAIYKVSELEFYLYYIPALLHDNFIKLFEKTIPTVSISKGEEYNKVFGKLSLQQIFYGAPGTGKSHRIKEDENVKAANEKNLVFRTTFHPDSDYSTFVGAYKPTIAKRAVRNVAGDIVKNTDKEDVYEDCITYSFVPQAFLQAYVAAWNNPEENVYLVIEEINRGNCAQIFGDLFQLLDRDCEGFSEYPIIADKDLKKYLNGKDEEGKDVLTNKDGIKDGKLRLPKNLFIWATMNTSDQSLFPIDSAFKRRWDWVYMPIDTAKETWYIKIGENYYSWTKFLDIVNDKLMTDETAEDKHLGFYFCKATEKKDGTENNPNVITAETFVGKVLFYLWNDVFKVYGIPSEIGSSKDWPYRKFYQTDGKVDDEKVKNLLQNIGVDTIDDFDNSSDDEIDDNEAKRQRKESLISIQIPNQPIIKASDSNQFDSFVQALTTIGIQKIISVVDKVKYKRLNYPVLSTMRYQEIDNNNKGYSYRQVGELFVIRGCKNYTYIRILEDLNEYLSLGLSLETK